jgi:hypothetical protein
MRWVPPLTKWFLAVTDHERLREVADLIVEAYRLSDTLWLAGGASLARGYAIEAVREAPVSLDPDYTPGVVPLRAGRIH